MFFNRVETSNYIVFVPQIGEVKNVKKRGRKPLKKWSQKKNTELPQVIENTDYTFPLYLFLGSSSHVGIDTSIHEGKYPWVIEHEPSNKCSEESFS